MRISPEYKNAPYEIAFDKFAWDEWQRNENSTDNCVREALKVLPLAMREELTYLQREYLTKYAVERWTMAEIANEYGVNKSTVCRTIAKAKKNLQKVLRYVSPHFW